MQHRAHAACFMLRQDEILPALDATKKTQAEELGAPPPAEPRAADEPWMCADSKVETQHMQTAEQHTRSLNFGDKPNH